MRLTHVFIDSFPEALEEGTLYVSMRYASTAHLCACGCGNEVVTPIKRRGWKLTFDGDSISLTPSIGSWNLPCQSHYFITNGEIEWCSKWSEERIQAGREKYCRTDESPQDHSTAEVEVLGRSAARDDRSDQAREFPVEPSVPEPLWKRLVGMVARKFTTEPKR